MLHMEEYFEGVFHSLWRDALCVGTSSFISILDETWLLNGDCINGNISSPHFM